MACPSNFAHSKSADIVKHSTSDACGATVCLYLHLEWLWCGLSEGSTGCGHVRRSVLIAWGVPLDCVDLVSANKANQLCRKEEREGSKLKKVLCDVVLAWSGVVVG